MTPSAPGGRDRAYDHAVPPSTEVPGLLRGLHVLRERWWIVLLAGVAALAAALAYSLSSTKQYSATSKLLFKQSELSSAVGGPSPTPSSDPEGDKATNTQLVQTNVVAERVRRTLRLPETATGLLGGLTVASGNNGNLVDVVYTDPIPVRAARISNAFSAEYVAYAQDTARRQVNEGAALIRRRLQALPLTATADRRLLQDALQKLIPIEALQTGNAEVVDRAAVPTSPSSPKTRRNAVVALLLGTILGIGIAFVIDLLDRRVKTVEEFEGLYRLRALTSIPERSARQLRDPDRTAQLEPFRILRNGLSFLSPRQPIRVVLITSAVPGEGKTTVAVGLARAVALSGRNVVLVEADLRRPSFGEQFDLGDDQRGLTSALVGGARATSLLREAVPGLRTLRVLPSGPLPPNSAELLRSAEMGDVLEQLSEVAEIVILDAPPLLPVADAQVLLDHPQVDACLVVGRANRTTRDEARRARAVIERLRLDNLGLVVNSTRELDRGYDYYGDGESGGAGSRRGSARLGAGA